MCFSAGFSLALVWLGLIEGIVVDSADVPQSNVTLILVETSESTVSDANGRFSFPLMPGVFRIRIADQIEQVDFQDGVLARVVLPTYQETIQVYPGLDQEIVVSREELAAEPGETASEFLGRTSATHQSGLGGALATVSVGGLAKHRVQTLINGIRISGDRRAGSDLGTVMPDLIGQLTVYRGGTATAFGSGAMGGVIDLRLPSMLPAADSTTAALSFTDVNSRTAASVSSRQGDLFLAAAYDNAGWYATPDGTKQDGSYRRVNAMVGWTLPGESWTNSFDLFLSGGYDIGKPSSSSTVTVYPEDVLNLLAFHASRDGFHCDAGVAFQKLLTESDDEKSSISSHSIQVRALYEWQHVVAGFDVYTRQNMNATNELETESTKPLWQASSWEISPYVGYTVPLGRDVSFGLNGRYQLSIARNNPETIQDQDFTCSGIFEIQQGNHVGDWWLFTSYRFPTLEEYFYTGLTARGFIRGNADLNPETGVGSRLSYGYRMNGWRLQASYQIQEVKDFITKVETSTDYYTYENVGSARIQDATLTLAYDSLEFGCSWAEGYDLETGETIDDIPPLKLRVSWIKTFNRWHPSLGLMHVFQKKLYGPSEQKLHEYSLVDAAIGFDLTDFLSIQLKGANLFNQEYLSSADEKAVDAPGRSMTAKLKLTF